LVVLRGFFKPSDRWKQYFVEGNRSRVAFTPLLPVIETHPCGHTQPRERAAVTLRILRDGPPKHGARLIGRVYKADSVTPVSDMGIDIEGPSGSIYKVTEAARVYDATDLPAGHYTVRLDEGGASGSSSTVQAVDLKSGDIGEWAFWFSSSLQSIFALVTIEWDIDVNQTSTRSFAGRPGRRD